MDDPQCVRLGERLAGLEDAIDRAIDRKWPLFLDDDREVRAFEVLHHHERRACLEDAHVEDARDVLAADLHGRAPLAKEARHHLSASLRLREEQLDRDALVELDVRGRDYDSHASDSEHALDTILANEHVSDAGNALWIVGG